MTWEWFFTLCSKPFKPLSVVLGHHRTVTLRALLFGGDLLILAILLGFHQTFQHHREYYAWLAGFAATLGMLFILTILSALINGYRRYRDLWMGLAASIMFILSIALALTATMS